jgi:hypothetical protein
MGKKMKELFCKTIPGEAPDFGLLSTTRAVIFLD